jgi:hypothetical protein
MPVKKGRMLISSVGTTVMSFKRFVKLIYKELDEINERIEALESLSVESPKVVALDVDPVVDLTVETYKESDDKEKINLFAVSIGLKSNKNKSIDTLKSDIDEKLKEVK